MSKTVALWGRDDFNNGTAPNDALRSIQAGLNAAINSDVVEVYTGNYMESLFQNTQSVMELVGIGLVEVTPPAPTAYFIDFNDRILVLRNLILKGFSKTIKARNIADGRKIVIEDCQVISLTVRGEILIEKPIVDESRQYPLQATKSLFVKQDFLALDIDAIEFCTFHDCLIQVDYNNFGDAYIQDCLMTSSHLEFTNQQVIIRNVLFDDISTFSYDDGANSVSNVDFVTFQAANATHAWSFDLSGCQVEPLANSYLDSTQLNFTIQATSLAIGMATNRGIVGAFQEGSQVNAVDVGWQNNLGFTLNGNQFETTTDAEIESPVIDFGINKPIKRIGGGMEDAWADGRVFNYLGNLSVPILTGGTQTGLFIALTDGAVYCVESFIEVVTNLRSFTITIQQCFTALANEQITEVTASGSGEIRELIYLDGHVRLLARWWKDGEGEPSTWQTITRDLPVLVDANGLANGDIAFDINNFPRHPVARYLRVKPIVTTNNLKS